MDQGFENFNDQDEEWLSDLEIRAMDLENELFDLREAHARELAETSYGRDAASGRTRELRSTDGQAADLRARPRHSQSGSTPSREAQPREAQPRQAQPRPAQPRPAQPRQALHDVIEDDDPDLDDDLTSVIRSGARPGWPDSPYRRPSAEKRTQTLIDRGRRSARQPRVSRSRTMVLTVAGLAVTVAVACFFIFRSNPSWPPSVATVQGEIATACQNANVASEPGQVNFACGKTTSQILWVFALMTSGDNPQFTDAKTGRKGLEPITPTQGGEVAWSLNLHHPYDPYNPVDSLQVAARALNNIIGGATLTSANGKPAVQPGLESDPANCVKYTGSSAVVSHAGFPSLCGQPVSSANGQAALVADAYRQWVVGATPAAAYDVSVLFANASNPGNPQVQAILKTLPISG
jgi:hypothetical protein